jgi:hypothetical protein
MRCIVDISRAHPKLASDYHIRLLRLDQGGWNERLESVPTRELLASRLGTLGLSVNRLDMALTDLRSEDRIVWFDCKIRDEDFARFGARSENVFSVRQLAHPAY